MRWQTMNAVIYARENGDIPIYEQFNKCAEYAKRYGYSISGKVLDYEGNIFHEAVNKVIADKNITILIIYSKDSAFTHNDDYLFFKIYLEKLGKQLVVVE